MLPGNSHGQALGRKAAPASDAARVACLLWLVAFVIMGLRIRQTRFCGLFRLATIAASRKRSSPLTFTTIPLRMPKTCTSHREPLNRLVRWVATTSTSAGNGGAQGPEHANRPVDQFGVGRPIKPCPCEVLESEASGGPNEVAAGQTSLHADSLMP
jgi:hypothetical protein